jgi:hypothetical protein
MNNRAPRDSREVLARPRTTFQPPSLLPQPEAQDGYVFRWVRTGTLGTPDLTNVSMRRREGWEPVKRADHPELASGIESIDSGEHVEIGGLMLCKASAEQMSARDAYYRQLSAQQIESVDNNIMRESDPRMPMNRPSRKSRVTYGSSD